MLAGLASLAVAGPTLAAVREPFEPPRFSTNDTGDIALVGNTLLTCNASAANCANARNGTGSLQTNNNFNMVNVDADSNASTFNSSRADFTLPAGGEVLWAGLYWGARSSNAARNQVLFQTPASDGYQPLTGEIVGSFGSPPAYHAFANVTDLVRQGGTGTYTTANVRADTGADRYAGWSLTVVYRDPGSPPRNLTVFDGFADVSDSTGNRQVDIPISGFQTPPAGSVNARIGVVAYEGDKTSVGDSLSLRGGNSGSFTILSDPLNPANDFFNSTISRLGERVADKQPDYINQLGFDADVVGANGIIPNGATNATLRLTTGGETYYPATITTAIELFAPVVNVDKNVEDVNGGLAAPGDVLEYTVDVTNSGQDFSDNTGLTDAIPDGTTYVPGSLEVVSGPNAGPKTDPPGDDQAEYDVPDDEVAFRVGAGANAVQGGTLRPGGQPDNSTSVRFRVRIDEGFTRPTVISNQAVATYQGRATGQNFTSNSPPSNITVQPRADLRIQKSAPDAVNEGEEFDYTLTVTNNGPDNATGVVVRDTLPEGVRFVSAPGCDPPNADGEVVCNVGELADGASEEIIITVRATQPGQTTNTAGVTGDTEDPTPGNNEDQAVTRINASADLSVTKSGPDGPVLVGEDFTYTIAVTNNGPSPATGVTVTDGLPEGVAPSPDAELPDGCEYDRAGNTVTCGPAQIAPDGTLGYELTVRASTVGEKSNTASVAGNENDPTPGNDESDPAVTQVNPAADLSIEKTGPTQTVGSGEQFTFTLVVTNNGPNDATGVTVTDELPGGIAFVSSPDGCTAAGQTVTCGPVGIPANGQETFEILVQGTEGGRYTNTASVEGNEGDPTPGNNEDSFAVTVRPVADLAIEKGAPAQVPNGAEFDYTLTVTNNGPDPAPNTVVRDVLPEGVRFVSADDRCQEPNENRVVVCNLGELAVEGSEGVTITVRATYPGGTTNTAGATSDRRDPDDSNNRDSAQTTITNADPDAVDDSYSTDEDTPLTVGAARNGLLANDGDPNGDDLTVTNFTQPENGRVTVGPDGTFTYTPNENFSGTDTFTYTVSDGQGGTDTATVTITVDPVNDAPVARPDGAGTDEDGPVTIPVLENDRDPDGDPLTPRISDEPQNGTVAVNPDGTVTYTPDPDFSGEDTFTYRACDDADPPVCSEPVTVTVNVRPVNDPPVAEDNRRSTSEDETLRFPAANLTGNDSPGPGEGNQTLTVTEVGNAQNGTVRLVDGDVVFTPDPNYNGPASFTYTVCDNGQRQRCDTATVNVDVSSVNDDPNAADDTAAAQEGGPPVRIPVLENDTDGPDEGESLSITGFTQPPAGGGTVECSETGCTFTPNSDFNGTTTFTYTISDGNGGTATATVTVNVAGTNDPPKARDDRVRTGEDRPVRVNVLSNDTDPEGDDTLDPGSVSITEKSRNGTVAGNPDGTVTYRPDENFSGTDTFTYRVCDEGDPRLCDEATATVEVAPGSPAADLGIEVMAPKKVKLGQNFPYTITVTNRGPDTAKNVVVRSRLPRAVSFVRAPAGCRYVRSSRTVVCRLGNVPDDTNKQRRILVKAEKLGTVSLRSCAVTSSTRDPDDSNNQTGRPGGSGLRSASAAGPVESPVTGIVAPESGTSRDVGSPDEEAG